MKGLRPNIIRLNAYCIFKSFLKLACRLVRKGNCKHLPRHCIAVADNMLYSFYNSSRFSRSCACNNKHRPVNCINNLLLLPVRFYCVLIHIFPSQ